MTVLLWIRFIAGIALILCGLVVFGIELYGVFKFGFVLNRMHAAAMGDTLGIALSMMGLIILCGLNFTSVKMVLVVVFLSFASCGIPYAGALRGGDQRGARQGVRSERNLTGCGRRGL